jgi:hypothetical protein
VLIGTALLAVTAWCGFQVYTLSEKRTAIKEDYSTLNNITYGLLSVNAWRDHVMNIVMNRIDDLSFTRAEKDTLEYEVEQILHAVVNKADGMLDQKQKTLKGKLKKFAIKTFVKEETIRKKVPEFAETIVNEVTKKKHRSKIKFLARSKLEQVGSITYDSVNDIKKIEAIMKSYNAPDVKTFNRITEGERGVLQQNIGTYTYTMIGVLIIFLLGWWLLRKQRKLHTPFFILSMLVALVVLLTGLTTPMIEIDARIKEMSFMLIGERIVFNDQVIFYQSKSIVDVVVILIQTHKVDSVLVGILILAFSILFPIGKLVATQIYLLAGDRWKNSRVIQYFAFHSGKWSMADVNVVAIFMAYIGFRGILNSQLENLNVKTESLASVSTNETSLEPGFILFLSFVIFSLILSTILHKTIPPREEKISEV